VQPSELTSGQTVIVQLKDAVCPDLADTLRGIGPELRVTGNIVFFSDGCNRENHFAIVEVAGIHTPLIVPVDRLESVARLTKEQSWQARQDRPKEAC